MESFSCRTKVISGVGALSALKELHSQRLLVVADPFFQKNGTASRVGEISGAEQVRIFSEVKPDPEVTLVAQGTAMARAFGPDTIVALGGGSAMDCAKAMACFCGRQVKLVAVPTTSGSGSEVTDFAILTHDNVKHPLIDEGLQPDMAILDGELLKELPPSLVADAGFDVLAHALEAYVATGAGAMSDAMARDAFCTAFRALPASFRGDVTVRQRIHTASTMAGIAFSQAGLGVCHALSHCLGGLFHVPHGRLNAILLPAVVACNQEAGAKYAQLCRSAGLSGSADTVAVRNLRNALIRLRQELELPATLAQAGVDPRSVWNRFDHIVSTTLQDPCCNTNPVPVIKDRLHRILEEVAGRG